MAVSTKCELCVADRDEHDASDASDAFGEMLLSQLPVLVFLSPEINLKAGGAGGGG